MAHPSTLQKNGSKFAFCLNFFARYSKVTVQVIKATGIKKSLVQKKKLAKAKTYIFFTSTSSLSFHLQQDCSVLLI